MTDHVEHDYLSTACLHEVHTHCRSAVNHDGQPKVPGTCKFCSAPCRCTCHTGLPVFARDTFPAQVTSARMAIGWSQGGLGAQVGVGQQAISSWENGKSVPQGDTLQRLCLALGFRPCRDLPDTVEDDPSTVRLGSLPFLSMQPDRFSDFTTGLLALLFPDAVLSADASRVIDLRVQTAGGERLVVHCFQGRKFHPSALGKLHDQVEQQEPDFDRALLLLRAGAGVKVLEKAAAWAPRWEIWESSAIAEHLHDLGHERALPLVEEYFPGLGKPFFGIAAEH